MTVDEIISGLNSPDGVSAATLQAGVAKADELAPAVFAAAEMLRRGVFLLPEQNDLLFYGLNILAAARHRDLFKQVLMISRLSEAELNQIFPDHIATSLARLLLSVWDGDADAFFELIEHAELIPDVKWGLFDSLARLTFEDRIPRARTIAFLERLERDRCFDDNDSAWWGWEEAVTKLGVTELETSLQRVWSKLINEHHSQTDHAESLELLHRAAANPTDPSFFDEDDIRPIDDPAEAVAWVDQRTEALARRQAERDGEEGEDSDDDPAKMIRLSGEEYRWLAGFLVCQQAPESTMTLEMLDGLLTALVIGPGLIPPSKYLSEIWGTEDGEGPVWESAEQAQYFMSLLMKHWNSIAARREADALHSPIIWYFGEAEPGRDWATGFLVGVELDRSGWEPIFRDKNAKMLLIPMLALSQGDRDLSEDHIPPEMRAGVLDELPAILRAIAAYWRAAGESQPQAIPLRSTKVGRNQPCPCGSGKKFKKCCGGSSPTLH